MKLNDWSNYISSETQRLDDKLIKPINTQVSATLQLLQFNIVIK
jgi:hypothetical protein